MQYKEYKKIVKVMGQKLFERVLKKAIPHSFEKSPARGRG